MTKILRYSCIIGAIMLIVIGFMPFRPAWGNPIPYPNPFTEIGTEFDGYLVKFKCANVTLDVYSTYTRATGTYIIENLANTTNNLNVTFIAWEREVNLTAVMVNQTPYTYSINCQYSCAQHYTGRIQLSFPPNGTQVLQLWWNFTSIDSLDKYYRFPEHIQWTSYSTGYLINGGNEWGGIPIEWEDVRFNFHTDAYFTSGRNISVILNNSYTKNSVQLPLDSNGVPYFIYHAENINSSIIISINNRPLFSIRDDLAIIILIIATGAAIGLPIFGSKKMRKSALNLSMMGFVCFALFIWMPNWNFLSWGVACLMLYVLGGLVIISKYYRRKRAIMLAGSMRLKALAHRRFYEENYPGAIAAYQESLSRDAHDFNTWTHLAHAYSRAGKEEKAKDACANALTSAPFDPVCIKLLRSLCHLLGIDPALIAPEALLKKGERLYSRGGFKVAAELFFAAYEAAIPDSPNEAEAKRWLEKCALKNGYLKKSGIKLWAPRLLICLLLAGGAFLVYPVSKAIINTVGLGSYLLCLFSVLALISVAIYRKITQKYA